MKKTIFLIFCFIVQCLTSAYAADAKKFAYCGGNIKFFIPKFLNKRSIEKQSEPATCKYKLVLMSKVGNKKANVDIRQSDDFFVTQNDITEEYLSQRKSKYPRQIHSIFSSENKNGTTTIVTRYSLDETGVPKSVDKDIFFGKKDSISAGVFYTGNPDDPNDVLFINALEQLFLSAEIDW